MRVRGFDRTFALLFTVMLAIAAGNTALQSILPALGRSLKVPDTAVAAVFSASALLWVIAAPYWASRSDRNGRRAMVLVGIAGYTVSLLICGVFLVLGLNAFLGPIATFVAFTIGRMIYGAFGCAAPPAVQALVAGRTTREERTKALTLIGSAFGLGTIIGPAVAPYLVLGYLWDGGLQIGLAGPAFIAAGVGVVIWVLVHYWLPHDERRSQGAAASYPSIGGQSSGATVKAALADNSKAVRFFDPRIRTWIIVGIVVTHAQAMTGQAIGFLIIDRLALSPMEALQPTGLVLMMGALTALLAQWGIIPMLDLQPRALVISGTVLSLFGCFGIAGAESLYGIALGYALISLGLGLARPGFTAGASLAVGPAAQGSVAGKVTSVNGAAFVLGPSLGVGLYAVWQPLPYLSAAAGLVVLLVYAWLAVQKSDLNHEESGKI